MMQNHVPVQAKLDPNVRAFYCQALTVASEAQIPFLLGGAYAFERYTGIARPTKDLDLFVRPGDCQRILEVCRKAGYSTEIPAPHWLAKVFFGEDFVDIIFRSANGESEVDDLWFEHAVEAEVMGVPVLLCPPEEMLWSKAFVMARDRFDGADVAHLLRACSERLDWLRLLDRFGSHWRVLLSQLILFGFIYPAERGRIPDRILRELLRRLLEEMNAEPPTERLCQGTLLSPMQYRIDVESWEYKDARLPPNGNLTPEEIAQWSASLGESSRVG
ncbi:MAG: nucleotidyltransferase family protein [Oscillatoria princeps RMCB-10]|jgi:hypothetical protein|nr:nucleotidyltransferase family protein [Oscillatoria princeps RMCB-10]